MTREEIIARVDSLSETEFDRVAAFLEADLEAVDELAALHREITAGRRSAVEEPLLDSQEVYARARRALSR